MSDLPSSNCASNHQSLATSCAKSNLNAPGFGLFRKIRAPLERREDVSDAGGQGDLSLSARSSMLATLGGSSTSGGWAIRNKMKPVVVVVLEERGGVGELEYLATGKRDSSGPTKVACHEDVECTNVLIKSLSKIVNVTAFQRLVETVSALLNRDPQITAYDTMSSKEA